MIPGGTHGKRSRVFTESRRAYHATGRTHFGDSGEVIAMIGQTPSPGRDKKNPGTSKPSKLPLVTEVIKLLTQIFKLAVSLLENLSAS